MGVALRCILEQVSLGVPHLEGKSLAMAYCGGGNDAGTGTSADIIAIDFGGGKPKLPQSAPAPAEPLLAPLDPFIVGDAGPRWHDAAKGLAAVRRVLQKLNHCATVEIAPDFPYGGDSEDELTEGLRYDLEELEQILIAAEEAGSRFYLAFDV